jgi:small GTP-binding protein
MLQEKFDSLTNFYCRGARAALICYDLTSRQSFTELNRWVTKIRIEAEGSAIIIVGTKLDLCTANASARQVTFKEGESYAQSVNARFLETSAKTGENIDTVFDDVVRVVLSQGSIGEDSEDIVDPTGGGDTDEPCC